MRLPQLPAPELSETEILKQRIEELETELATTREEYEAQRNERINAMRNMPEVRRLYSMLCLLFGHEDGQPHHVTTAEVGQPIPSSRYDAWKARLPDACGKIIDALLVQPLTRTQLKGFCKLAYSTVAAAVTILANNDLVEEIGDKIKLK